MADTEYVRLLLDTLTRLRNELQAWQSIGDSRPATWTESRIRMIDAVLAKVPRG